MEDEFTGRETERQDCVDNAIANLISDLIPEENDFDWDIEIIADVREVIQEYLVDKLGIMTEQEFYPYRELEPAEPKKPEFPEGTIFVTDEQLSTAVKGVVDELDADDLCTVAGEWLGGVCWIGGPKGYAFIPDIWYGGAFDYLKEKSEDD